MKRYALLFGMVLAGVAWICGRDSAQEFYPEMPACEPGFRLVRKVEYKEVEHRFCKVVPEKRTKWVYSTKPDYYCVPACPIHGHRHVNGCDDCQACQNCNGPYYRPQLMKKQIQWECGKKCVVETVKEKVPFVVWRKVPLGAREPGDGRTPETLPAPKKEVAPLLKPFPSPRVPANKD